jgi:hypothetical protein
VSTDPLAFLNQSQAPNQHEESQPNDSLSFLNKPSIRTRYNPTLKEKVVRKASQVPIGIAEYATWPYNAAAMAVNWGDKKIGKGIQAEAQRALGEIEEAIAQPGFEWTPEKKEMYDKIKKLSQDPGNLPKLDVGSMLEKGIEKTTGINVKPETGDEHLLRLGSAIRNPSKWGKSLAKLPKRFTKEGRQFLKGVKQEEKYTSLLKTHKGNPEKEGILNFAKERGLSPEAATLLTQTAGKTELLGKLAKKSKKYKGIVEEIETKLGDSYGEIEKIAKEGGRLGVKQTHQLGDELRGMAEGLKKSLIIGPDTKSAINAIEEGLVKLEMEGATLSDLIKTRQNLSQSINWNNVDPKGRMLNQAREIFFKAIEKANPAVAKQLRMTDKAYGKLMHSQKILGRLPHTVNVSGIPIPADLAIYGASASHVGGATTKLGLIKASLRFLGQKMFTNFLVNPKYQGLHKKLIDATIKGDKEQVGRLMTIAYNRMKEDDPDFGESPEDQDDHDHE